MTCEASTRRLKTQGWYWGSISPQFAVSLLKNEQDGTFLIRDSTSDCYIFSITYKIDGRVHHTRIEHSRGYYSFERSDNDESRKVFKRTTLVDFIEQAIELSQTEDLKFFLHRDPSFEGPVRLRLIPLSRLQCLSSLKHMCRFAILPYIRKDKIYELPSVPDSLKEYLYEPFYDPSVDSYLLRFESRPFMEKSTSFNE